MKRKVYLRQPKGFVVSGKETKVLQLWKSLYGLKQAPQAWYNHLNTTFTEIGFKKCQSNHSVWVWAKDGIKIIIPVYIDNLTLVCNNLTFLKSIKRKLAAKYKLCDLGEVKYLLGIKIKQDRKHCRLTMNQGKFAQEVLHQFQAEHFKAVSTPLSLDIPLVPNPLPDVNKSRVHLHLQIIGSLMYLAITTRPDLSQAVGALSCYNANPSKDHLKQAYHVLQYLVGTQDMNLVYNGASSKIKLTVYSDADWAGNKETHHSTSGSATYIGNCLVNWRS